MKRLVLLFIMILFVNYFAIPVKAEAADLYTVGINDILEIKVLGQGEGEKPLETMASVSSDGSISFPYIGIVYVKGKHITDIQNEITKKLSEGFIKYPVVSVSLVKSLSRNIYAYGEVFRRGEIPYDDNMTVLTALSLAGGITNEGLYGKVKVRRKKEGKNKYTDIEIDLKGIIEGGLKGDVLLEPGDIIIVERNKLFFVYGEVKRGPGEYVLEKDMTVSKALAVAGGISADGLYGKIKVKRKNDAKTEYKDINIDLNGAAKDSATGDMLIEPDDILMVERNKTFFIQGLVARVGEYTLERGMTVERAISVAGGIVADGIYGKIKIKRKKENELGYEDITIDLNGNIEGNAKGEIPIEPDDILTVDRNKTFFVYGEVNRPGEYVLKDNLTVFNVISLAGGFTKWGSPDRVEVLRLKDNGKDFIKIKVKVNEIIKGNAEEDILLKAGDTLIVSASIF